MDTDRKLFTYIPKITKTINQTINREAAHFEGSRLFPRISTPFSLGSHSTALVEDSVKLHFTSLTVHLYDNFIFMVTYKIGENAASKYSITSASYKNYETSSMKAFPWLQRPYIINVAVLILTTFFRLTRCSEMANSARYIFVEYTYVREFISV